MKVLLAFMKKEWMEVIRNGKFVFLIILFTLFGIMNPAIAKLTPWLMEQMSSQLAEAGMIITEAKVDALTSWTQFFKNLPIGLIVFAIMFSGSFTKEYQSGTMQLLITKGLARFKILFSKLSIMVLLWSLCYWICYFVTFFYNSYYWDNSVANQLVNAAVMWWLFGLWIMCLIVLLSTISNSSGAVMAGTFGIVVVSYVMEMFPGIKEYVPTFLLKSSNVVLGVSDAGRYTNSIIIVCGIMVICFFASILLINKKKI